MMPAAGPFNGARELVADGDVLSLQRIAALPMYDFPELAAAHDALWSALAVRLTAAGIDRVPERLDRRLGYIDTWRHPRLLLGQACEYPLAKSHGHHVRLVASPRYTAPGCDGARCRSAIVVRVQDAAQTLSDLRGRRCAVNQLDSNSGMNLLRATLAPLSTGTAFFGAVVVSGSHRESARMVVDGRADTAALDGVSFAHFERFDAALAAGLRVLDWTPAGPTLPFITAQSTDGETVRALRGALADVAHEPAAADVRERLLLAGFDCEPRTDFGEVLRLEGAAAAAGYPVLY